MENSTSLPSAHSSLPADERPQQPLRLPNTRLSNAWAILGCAVFLGLIFFLDVITPADIAFSYYYAVPVLAVTWFVGRRAGFVFIVLALVLRTWAEVQESPHSTTHVAAAVNFTTRTFALVMAVMMLASLKNFSTRLGIMVEERTDALRQMATRLAEAEDTERRRLAGDLHDGLSQMLSLLKLHLSAALTEQPAESVAGRQIQEAIGMVNDLIQKSRSLTFDLHPAMLDHLGLVPTLRQLGEDFARQTRVEMTIDEEGTPRPLDVNVARHLFRSVKELMSNAARHGHAGQIVVSVHWMADSLRLTVDDDGDGFDPKHPIAPDARKGLGLPSINERLLSLGGSMSIESDRQTGTRVALEVPLPIEATTT
jgi:signal transduction histidine kinase